MDSMSISSSQKVDVTLSFSSVVAKLNKSVLKNGDGIEEAENELKVILDCYDHKEWGPITLKESRQIFPLIEKLVSIVDCRETVVALVSTFCQLISITPILSERV